VELAPLASSAETRYQSPPRMEGDMRKLRTLVASVAFATLAACSQGSGAVGAIDVDPNTIEAHVTKLVGETLKGKATAAADLEPLRAMLPPEVAMSWGNLSFDAATGSTLITDLKVTPKDMPAVGVQVSELRLWDFDAKLLQDRVSGLRLTETAPLARRIDAKGVSLFGMADVMNAQFQSIMPDDFDFDDFDFPEPAEPVAPTDDTSPTKFQQPIDPTAPQPGDDPFASVEDIFDETQPMMKVDRYDVSIGRIVLDDIVLKPYQVSPAPPAAGSTDNYDTMAMMLPVLQQFASIAQSYGIDTAAYFDFKVGMDMTQYGEKMVADISVAAMGARGMRGGDLDGMFIRDVNYAANIATGVGPNVDMQYTLANMTLEDMRLGKVMDYLVKGVLPPRTESNLMSLGVWRSKNEAVKLGGKPIYTVDESMVDASGWHWFIPTKITTSGKNMSLDIGAIMEFGQQMNASAAGDFADDPVYAEQLAAENAQMQQVMATISKHGLSKPTMDYNFGWNWNAGNGDTRLDIGLDGKELLQFSAKYEGAFPSFKAVSDLIPENGAPDEMALMNVFQTNSSLKLIELNVEDKGGLPKIFGLVGDMSPAMQPGAPPMTGEQVRAMAVDGITMMARPDVSGVPELAPLMTPVANFVRDGGKLRVLVQPAKPMPFSGLMATVMMAGMGSPAQAIKDLGLKVEHSK
jgi:hypothetical protein